MPIDFHASENKESYATRDADQTWVDAIAARAAPHGKRVLDIGCGGGIYTRAWANLGAASVTGVDFSAVMLEAAAEHCHGIPNVAFHRGNATATGLPDGSADIVFERAVIHHVPDMPACFPEAYRLLAPGGLYIIQDKTPQDIQRFGTPEYIGGYFFERFPRLLEVERARRPQSETVCQELAGSGFTQIEQRQLLETHRTYRSFAELADALRQRTGRSIAHDLSDAELADLIAYIRERIPQDGPITEKVYWTLWWARK